MIEAEKKVQEAEARNIEAHKAYLSAVTALREAHTAQEIALALLRDTDRKYNDALLAYEKELKEASK